MIYLDNSATSLHKPPEVAQAVAFAIQHFGNPGRSFHLPAMRAAREVFLTRVEIARLVGLEDPLQVAFTSGATESLNLVLNSLITKDDGVITSVLEHNSVLRPLYRIGCPLSLLDCDEEGNLLIENLPRLVTSQTRFVVCAHGSNLLGSITDVKRLYALCRELGLTLILDAAQTLGSIETTADMADVICFTGHKALLGPQGTGGVISKHPLPFALNKTGGTGADSFAPHQPLHMPDVFEAGTQNAHSLYGLQKGALFVNQTGVAAIQQKEKELAQQFLEGVARIPGITLHGPKHAHNRLPVFALQVAGYTADDVALRLWDGWQIATRAGSHCAPLVHRYFFTEKTGMVRLSAGFFTTEHEIDTTLQALEQIASEGRAT